jgi:hypothetical protein
MEVTPKSCLGGDIVGGNGNGLHRNWIFPSKTSATGFQLRGFPGYDHGRDHGARRQCGQRHDPVVDREASTIRSKPFCEEHTNAADRSTGKRRCLQRPHNHGGRHQSTPSVTRGGTQCSPVPVKRVSTPCCYQPWTGTASDLRSTATHSNRDVPQTRTPKPGRGDHPRASVP